MGVAFQSIMLKKSVIMKIDKIITFANKKSEIRFKAMERSLRATGCNLPVWVIPYDSNTFELPDNCVWWEIKEITQWLEKHQCFNMMRKYQCLTTLNYQYVDSDIIFLRNPEEVLANHSGFITSCGHWHHPDQTMDSNSLKYFREASTTWEQWVFNCGQFACDKQLYDVESLIKTGEDSRYKPSCLDVKLSDQPGYNLYVLLSGIKITNLTLQPHSMQSTWAGDYEENYTKYWSTEAIKPYIIHWAGCRMDTNRPIDELFLNCLTEEEKHIWFTELNKSSAKDKKFFKRMYLNLLYIKNALKSINYE